MKRLLIALLIMMGTKQCVAEMRYNPLNDLVYSHPETPDINQDEYRVLVLGCAQIRTRIVAISGKQPSKKEFFNQCSFYLKAVGTPTALRLLKDIRANVVNYADGSFMRKIVE